MRTIFRFGFFGNSRENVLEDALIFHIGSVVAQDSESIQVEVFVYFVTKISGDKLGIDVFCTVVLCHCKAKVAIADTKTRATAAREIAHPACKTEIIAESKWNLADIIKICEQVDAVFRAVIKCFGMREITSRFICNSETGGDFPKPEILFSFFEFDIDSDVILIVTKSAHLCHEIGRASCRERV